MAIYLDWNGEKLSPDVLALSLFTVPGTSPDAPIPILAAAATNDDQALIRPDRLGRFLIEHAEHKLVCANAAELHWTIAAMLDPVQQSQELQCLWSFSRESRLLDVLLLDEWLCRGKEESLTTGGLVGLAHRCLERKIDSSDDLSTRILATRVADPAQLDPHLQRSALNQARCLRDIFQSLRGRSGHFPVGFGSEQIGPVPRFGPCKVGLHVQGAIALRRAIRYVFCLDEVVAAELVGQLETERSAYCDILASDPIARRAFRVQGDQIKIRGDFLVYDRDALPDMLDRLLARLICPNGEPWPRVFMADGRISQHPEDYGALRECDPILNAWSRCQVIGRALRLLRANCQQPLAAKYEVLPRIWTEPSQEVIRQLIGLELLHASAGGAFVIVTLPDLELRALASLCESRLSKELRRGAEVSGVVEYVARQLQKCGVQLLSATAADQADPWPAIAKELLRAAGLMLGRHNTLRMLNQKLSLHITGTDCKRLHEVLFAEFPELKTRIDWTVDSLSRRTVLDLDAGKQHSETMPGRSRDWQLAKFGDPTMSDRADEAVKSGLYAIVAAGYQLAACAANEIAIAFPSESAATKAMSDVQGIVSTAAAKPFNGIPVPSICEVRQTW